jgi:hypothetical protein
MAPAPMTLSPDAANVATILNKILYTVFNFPSYSNELCEMLLFFNHSKAY